MRNTIRALMPLTLIAGCALPVEDAPVVQSQTEALTERLEIPSIAPQDGAVLNWGLPSPLSPTATVGTVGFWTRSRAILSFDTSVIPEDAEIVAVHLFFDVTEFDNVYDQWWQDAGIEISGPLGFGGSRFLTGLDYAAPAAAEVAWVPNLLTGHPVLYTRGQIETDVPGLLNRHGITQLRLAFDNPHGASAKLSMGEAEHPPTLVVIYE